MSTYPSEESIGFLLNQASRSVVARLSDQFRELGLDEHGWVVLRNAYAHQGNGCTPFAIAARLHIPAAVNVTAATRLVRDGWLTTGDGGPVGETSSLCVTQKAKDMMPGLEDTARWIVMHATNGFSARECEEFTALLKRFNENLA